MKIILLALISFLALNLASAQTPAPIVVTAMPAAATASAPGNSAAALATAQLAESTATLTIALRSLEAVKAANEELLKKQAATLQQLDELQKAADQLKIYSKRG
ncbi:MAG: hypothetical protein ABI992_03775 [Chthoniobacterales bacterium]